MVKAKPVAKAVALDKKINTSVDALSKANSEANAAVTKRTAEAKKLLAEVKRHLKKKTTLTKRSKTASATLKKDANAANRKAGATITKELKTTQSALDKARTGKAVVLTELASLRIASKKLNAYSKAIASCDKALNKPAKKRRIARKSK
jgi:thiamine kinase-like enzyme